MTLLDTLLTAGRLTSLFQPIVRLHEDTVIPYAYECLTRGPAGTNLERADVLFHYVRRKGAESAVDRACIATALRRVRHATSEILLSFNVHAATLSGDRGFPLFLLQELERATIDPRDVIIEIIEHSPAWRTAEIRASIAELRSAGVRIALDDIGLGHSNYRMILDVEPNYFKLDRYVVSGCHQDSRRIAVIASLARLAFELRGFVIAEGIDDLRDVEPLTACGVELFQGFLFGEPFGLPEAEALRPLVEAQP